MADLRASFVSRGPGTEMSAEDLRAWRIAYAAKQLRSGRDLPDDLRQAIADLIEEPPRPRGRPSSPPAKWYEVGQLRDAEPGLTVEQIADRLGITKRTAERGLAYHIRASAK